MSGKYPDFQIQLPRGGPLAYGRLLDTMGTNGSQNFLIVSGAPVRKETVPSFQGSSYELRERLRGEGKIVQSTRFPGYWETTEDIKCNSPSAAAEVVTGSGTNGWTSWKTYDGRPLKDFLSNTWHGSNRTWLVRGSNVSGLDLVQQSWRPKGLVSQPAGYLRAGVEQGISKDGLRTAVEEDYGSLLTHSQRVRLVDELHSFLSQMKPGDTVCTLSHGSLYVGEITGPAKQDSSEGGLSNLCRPVEWQDAGHDYHELPEELQQKLSAQHDVVDLTAVAGLVAGLGRSTEELDQQARADGDTTAELAALARRKLELPEPTEELAKELLVHDIAWLQEVRELLWDERQLVFHGPPGTGKTYLALKLAEYLGGGAEQVTLVQFHPSYSYEDFFEGFRPQGNSGEVAFRLVDGPLRQLADAASREGNRHIPHFLVVDEINRANLAKVFGELYFLLEYRNRSVRLTYSGDDFALPPNLFVLGTMNTADRSIALVDAAMRRRFAFVELSPRVEPTRGLLRRWLQHEGHETGPADLLDALNARIDDPDFRIGPSYLMRESVYRDGGLDRAWRTRILPLLTEHHYGDGVDVEQRYGLRTLRAAVAASRGGSSPE
ncbi:DUF4357 domain-containing protein [Saccharomonospora iraqiensis]|uniref:DUF4357 domain-containing protein n=1 Tax=Saccharomonospora iraqiensis TaxID=52698 RepID=UPI00022E0E59|nr:DUF4357 domain-containing protein [Saccharomonospora iraqiensis]